MGVPGVVNTPVHWHLGMSADDPNVVQALADLGVPTEPHQVHELSPELWRALQALGAGDESRVGIWVHDPDVVRALEALGGPVESRPVYEVGPPIRWPQQVSRPAVPARCALPSCGGDVVRGMLPPGLLGGGQAAVLSWQPTAAKEPEA